MERQHEGPLWITGSLSVDFVLRCSKEGLHWGSTGAHLALMRSLFVVAVQPFSRGTSYNLVDQMLTTRSEIA
jgi:hypothetical protein